MDAPPPGQHVGAALQAQRAQGSGSLLVSALQALGFELCLRAARVWYRVPAAEYAPLEPPIPRLHVVLVVRVAGANCSHLLVAALLPTSTNATLVIHCCTQWARCVLHRRPCLGPRLVG